MCAKHTMRVLSGMQPRQVDEMISKYHLNMLQTREGLLLFEGELEDLRKAAKHVVDVTLPPGPSVSEIKETVNKFNIQLKQSDEGPQFHGTLYDINDAINYLVDIMKERLNM